MLNKYTYSDVTFIIPSRENLHFLKYAYKSIRENIGLDPYILCADDYSIIDGSRLWMEEIKQVDERFDYIVNSGPERLGHVILFDSLVERVKTKLFVLSHADMVWLKGSLDGLLDLMDHKRVISATRCEPTIHPSEHCKISLQWLPSDPSELDEPKLQKYVDDKYISLDVPASRGIFAPYLMETDEYLSIGGCDSLFRPTSREDDDLWNRLLFNGCEFYQSWKSFVYHRSCAGSRWNPTLTSFGQNSTEWDNQQMKSLRNYIRKWKSVPVHDKWHHPIIPYHQYNVALILTNASYDFIPALEPWFDHIASDLPQDQLSKYIEQEQPNTLFNLTAKLSGLNDGIVEKNDIIVRVDSQRFSNQDWNYIQNLSDILTDSGEIGSFQLGNLQITINALTHYEKDLIVCKNEPINLNEPFYGTDPTKFVDGIFVGTD